jgi:phosphoglycolate phosphatase
LISYSTSDFFINYMSLDQTIVGMEQNLAENERNNQLANNRLSSKYLSRKSTSAVASPPQPINLDDKNHFFEFLTRFDFILCDCDGVLWVNNDAVHGVPQVLNKLRALGKQICFATNNSTKTREEFLAKLEKLGYDASIDELFPTSYSTAVYLQSIGFDKTGQKVFIVGSSGIAGELAKIGIESVGVGPDPTPRHWTPGMAEVEIDPDIGAVVVGFDNQVSFPKLTKACSYVGRQNCLFIASNSDESYPHPDHGVLVPGPGCYVAAIEAVTKQKAIPLGKPFKFFFDCIRYVHPEIDPKKTVMIGDRLTTDMVFGRNNGLTTLFVESGIGTYDEMVNYRNSGKKENYPCVPDYYCKSLAVLDKYLHQDNDGQGWNHFL